MAAATVNDALTARVAELEQRLEASARSETRRSLALGALVLTVVGLLALHGKQPSSISQRAETIGEAPQARTSRRLLQFGTEEPLSSAPIIAPAFGSDLATDVDVLAREQAQAGARWDADLERLLTTRRALSSSWPSSYSFSFSYDYVDTAPLIRSLVTIAFDGIDCSGYTTPLDIVVRKAVASLISGVDVGDIANGTCTDSRRRALFESGFEDAMERRLSSSASVDLDVSSTAYSDADSPRARSPR